MWQPPMEGEDMDETEMMGASNKQQQQPPAPVAAVEKRMEEDKSEEETRVGKAEPSVDKVS